MWLSHLRFVKRPSPEGLIQNHSCRMRKGQAREPEKQGGVISAYKELTWKCRETSIHILEKGAYFILTKAWLIHQDNLGLASKLHNPNWFPITAVTNDH